ncbi:DUF6284 family protein [Streptomyces sp. NPDC086023]|uniref:DUF6284 family protein n=1 Tax=Streptomyces sp. NPDC086023 TaxID=3365746 RepID=UPI0037D27057
MESIVARHMGVTALPAGLEPTAAELDAIELELPLILAERDELDAQIMVLDRVPSEVDLTRLRRARRRVLAARTALENRAAAAPGGVA